MQHSPEDLKRRLLACIDEDCNVTDMAGCLSVVTILEQTPITRKILEDTRLGKYVNGIRRQTRDQELPRRLKNLVRKWRDACQAECVNGVSPRGPGPGGGGSAGANGRQSISPPFSAPSSIKGSGGGLSPCSLPSSGHTSPMGRASAPASPLGRASVPTTPSTLASGLRRVSSNLCVAKGPLSSSMGGVGPLHSKARALSPATISSSHGIPGSSKPQSPSMGSVVDPAYTPRLESVPRTHAANKRLRKGGEEEGPPPSKRPRHALSNGFEDECSRDSLGSVASVEGGPPSAPRKSGRRRRNAQDSPGGPATPGGVDPLRQKMAVIGGAKSSSKVKTTSELVAELARRKGDVVLARRASRLEEQVRRDPDGDPTPGGGRLPLDSVTQNKKEHMEKFLKSHQPGLLLVEDDDEDEVTILDDEDEDDSEQTSTLPPSPAGVVPLPFGEPLPFLPPSRPDSPPSNMDLLGIGAGESAHEILARLPPLDVGAIVWEEEGDLASVGSVEDVSRAGTGIPPNVVDPALVQTLHSTNVEGQNGNFDMDGRFREWHEVILQKAYQSSPLVVLPYVITDF